MTSLSKLALLPFVILAAAGCGSGDTPAKPVSEPKPLAGKGQGGGLAPGKLYQPSDSSSLAAGTKVNGA